MAFLHSKLKSRLKPSVVRNRRDRRQGAVLVEFGIVLPLLLLIILGCIDFGRFAYLHIAVTNAARSGAEFAAMRPVTPASQPFWQAGIEAAVQDEMQNNGGYIPGELVVAPATVTSDPLNLRRVRVQVQHPFRTLVNWPGIPDETLLTRAVEMRVLR